MKERSFSRQLSNDKENRQISSGRMTGERQNSESHCGVIEDVNYNEYKNSTSNDFINSCKSGLRRLTYRKTYSRTKSNKDLENGERNGDTGSRSSQPRDCQSPISTYDKSSSMQQYSQLSSGTRIPHRPTTPGPYLGMDRPMSPALDRPTTPGPFTRESWKRTNHKYNHSRQSCKDTFSFQPFFGL